MTTRAKDEVTVDVPVNLAYNQWTQFEDFPEFMDGVVSVDQVTDSRLHWVAEVAGVRREWDAEILEQLPDRKVAWAATEGATNAGAVYFESVEPGRTRVRLELEYEPEGLVEKAGDALGLVERQAKNDLARFKAFIEDRDVPTGGWRGEVSPGSPVGTPGTDAAAASRGDSGKAGMSPTAVAGAAAVGAAAVAAGVAAKRSGADDEAGSGRDVVDILTSDHAEITALLATIRIEADPTRRRDLADTVVAELVRHSVSEEMHVYPAMRKHLPDGDQAVQHDIEEHKEIESLLRSSRGADAPAPNSPTSYSDWSRSSTTTWPTRSTSGSPCCAPASRPRSWWRSGPRWSGPSGSPRPGRIRTRPTPSCSTSSPGPASGWWTGSATG